MLNKKLLTTFCLAVGMLLPQGAWADDLNTRTTPNGELAAVRFYGKSGEYFRYTYSNCTVGSSDNTKLSLGGQNTITVNATTRYVSLVLSGETTFQEGDVISVEGIWGDDYNKNYPTRGFTYWYSKPTSDGTDKVTVSIESGYKANTMITREYTIPAESPFIGKNTVYVSTNSGSVNLGVHRIAIKRSGSDDLMPAVLSDNKTWNFTTISGGVNGSITAVDGRIVNDDLYYGNAGSTNMTFANKLSATIHPLYLKAKATEPTNFNLSANNTNALMFYVPAGTGIVKVKHMSSGSSNLTKITYKIGNNSAVTASSMSSSDKLDELSFVYDVTGPTPIWICSTNDAHLLVNEISVIMSETVTLDNYGNATFASAYPLDLAHMSATTTPTAYKAAVSGTRVDFTPVDEAVAANTGILLQGGADETVTIPVVASGTDISSSNDFKVNTSGTTMGSADTENNYFFAMKKNQTTLTFATFDPKTLAIPSSKAYLEVPKSSFSGSGEARVLSFFFNDEEEVATGISNSELGIMNSDQVIFDLQGRRVAQPTKGLYIVNGKKVVIK